MTENAYIQEMKSDLESLGVRSGGVLLVHSSLKSLGQVPGGAETVILGLLEALGPEGTLLIPALSYATVNADNPVFDVRNTPCCIGWIPEYFRTRNGTLRSVNPTHSVCGTGHKVISLLEDHYLDHTPVGPHSPFHLLKDYQGQILMLGCGLCPNTSMHGIEELVEPSYLFRQMQNYQIIHEDGKETQMECRRHNFAGWKQRYDRVAEVLSGDEIRQGKVRQADSYLIEATSLWDKAYQKLRVSPFFFVDPQ